MPTPSPIILHHFDQSPFSERIRVIFGFKELAWSSVRISRIMPRPDLMPLTGGGMFVWWSNGGHAASATLRPLSPDFSHY